VCRTQKIFVLGWSAAAEVLCSGGSVPQCRTPHRSVSGQRESSSHSSSCKEKEASPPLTRSSLCRFSHTRARHQARTLPSKSLTATASRAVAAERRDERERRRQTEALTFSFDPVPSILYFTAPSSFLCFFFFFFAAGDESHVPPPHSMRARCLLFLVCVSACGDSSSKKHAV
jgi:hypothetical protein